MGAISPARRLPPHQARPTRSGVGAGRRGSWRFLAVLTLAAWALVAMPTTLRAAEGDDQEARGVQGGRSAATAPLLSEGRYRDSVLAGDVRWYGFDLGPGDTLRATMSLTGGNVDTLTPFAQVQVELRSEDVLGDLRCDVASARELSDPAGQVRLGQEPMQIASHQIEPAGELCRAPGRYFVRVALIDDVRPTRLLRLRGIPGELQYDLSVEVSSSPEVQATTPEEPGAGTGDGGPSARPAGLQDPDMSMAVMAFAGFGFALAGFATGTAAGRRLVGSR